MSGKRKPKKSQPTELRFANGTVIKFADKGKWADVYAGARPSINLHISALEPEFTGYEVSKTKH